MHNAVVLLAEGQRAVAAEVAVGLGLADLALGSKGRHEQDDVFYLIENGCSHNHLCFLGRKYTNSFSIIVRFPR